MKKTVIYLMIGLQALTMGGIAYAIHLSYNGKQEVAEAKKLMEETKSSLASTVAFMDEMQAIKQQEEAMAQPLTAGRPAPTFNLPNQNEQQVSLTDYAGKNVLLVFSQVGCSYCDSYYPELKTFTDQNPDTEVVVLQFGSTAEENRAFMASTGLSATTFLTPTPEVLASYKIVKTPTSVLLGKDGQVLGSENIITLADLETFVNAAGTLAMAQ